MTSTAPFVLAVCIASAIAGGCASPPAGAIGHEGPSDATLPALSRSVAVPLAEAVAAATQARPGEAVEARIEASASGGEGAATILVTVLFADATGPTRRAVVSVDPHSGRAIYVRNDRDAPTISDALRATLAAPHASLAEVIANATAHAPGRAVFAALGDSSANTARVRIVRGAVVEETTISTARAD